MITFANEKRPPVLDTIKEAGIPHHGTFIFNNSALFVDPDNTPNDRIFWKSGKQGFKIFFKTLDNVNTRSLTLTKEVLQTRKRFESRISRI